MSIAFVVMRSIYNYEENDEVNPIFVTGSEDVAKAMVLEKNAEIAKNDAIASAKAVLRNNFMTKFDKENAQPKPPAMYPAFDQSRNLNKDYVKKHNELKRKYKVDHVEFLNNTLIPWYNDRNAKIEKLVEKNFDPSAVPPSPRGPSERFSYEAVESDI